MLKQILSLGRGNKRYMVGQVAFQWLAEMLVVSLLWVIVDRVISQNWSRTGLVIVGCQVILSVSYFIFSKRLSSGRWAQAAATELQDAYLSAYMSQTKLKDAGVVEVVQQGLGTIKRSEVIYTTIIPTILQLIITGIVMLVADLAVNPLSAAIPFIGVLGVGMGMMLLGKMGNRRNLAYIRSFNQMGDRFIDDFSGLKTLIMYGRQKRYASDFAADSENFRQKTMRVLSYQLQTLTIMDFCLYGALGWFVIVQGSQVQTGSESLPAAVLVSALTGIWLIDFRKFGYFIHLFMSLMPRLKPIFQLIKTTTQEEPVTTSAASLEPEEVTISGQIGYRDQPLFEIQEMTLSRGHVTGLIGVSGSGKSTLAKVLMKNLPLLSGNVRVDHQALTTLSRADWWRTIGYLGAQTHLFSGTIADNLTLGAEQKQDWQSRLTQLGLCQFVNQLPDRFETQVGENGQLLSSGQRQQIAISRAILADKQVYIFDEVTSNIDSENAEIILKAIESLAQQRIVLLITHRIADIEQLTTCYFIDQQHLVAGTPAQLMRVPAFKALVEAQESLLREVRQ